MRKVMANKKHVQLSEEEQTRREREKEKGKRELVVFVRVAEIQSDGLISLLPATSSSQ